MSVTSSVTSSEGGPQGALFPPSIFWSCPDTFQSISKAQKSRMRSHQASGCPRGVRKELLIFRKPGNAFSILLRECSEALDKQRAASLVIESLPDVTRRHFLSYLRGQVRLSSEGSVVGEIHKFQNHG